MQLAAAFDSFLDTHVNLNPDRLTTLTDCIDAIESFLRSSPVIGDEVIDVIPQGSFAQRTIIEPPGLDDEFDADVLLQMRLRPNARPASYNQLLAAACAASGRYADLADPGKRCVTIDYANEFHIDIVPFVVASNGQFITNSKTDGWEETNPQGFNQWLAERDQIANGRLVEVIRLAKYLREQSDVEFAGRR